MIAVATFPSPHHYESGSNQSLATISSTWLYGLAITGSPCCTIVSFSCMQAKLYWHELESHDTPDTLAC